MRRKNEGGIINVITHCTSSDKKDCMLLSGKKGGGGNVYNTTVSVQCDYNHLNMSRIEEKG